MREYSIDEKLRILEFLVGERRTNAIRQMYFMEDSPLERKMFEDGPQLEQIIAEIKEKRGEKDGSDD